MLTVTTYYLYLYTVYEMEFCELYINKKNLFHSYINNPRVSYLLFFEFTTFSLNSYCYPVVLPNSLYIFNIYDNF